MKLFVGLEIGLKEVWANKFRSFLTMLGIILGVASLLSMFALTAGIAKGAREILEQIGGIERIEVSSKEASEHLQDLADTSPGRTMADVEALRSGAPLLTLISPESTLYPATVSYGAVTTRRFVTGATLDYLEVNKHVIGKGRFLGVLDLERYHHVAVVGASVVEELWPDEPDIDPIGRYILINQRPFEIVGVFTRYETERARRLRENTGEDMRFDRKKRSRYDSFYRKNTAVIIPITTMFQEFKSATAETIKADQGPDWKLDTLAVQVANESLIEPALKQMHNVLIQTHRGIDDFAFETREEYRDRIETSIRATQLSGGLIAGISLLVGGIGITNIMLASITERVREIGVRRAVGARARDIFGQIVVEAVVIGFIGGFIGLVASLPMIKLLVLIAPSENTPVVEFSSLLMSFGSAVIIGIISGLYPAWKASRLDPIQALRYE